MDLVKLILICLVITGCKSTNSVDESIPRSISDKAQLYANNYEYDLLKSSTLMIKEDGYIKEQFIINDSQGWISRFIYEDSPYDQFLNMFKIDIKTPYNLAKKQIKRNLSNFSAQNCESIKTLIKKYNNRTDLSTNQKTLPVKVNSPTYIYQYKSGVQGVEHRQIRVTIEEHPIVDFYNALKVAITECPYPEVPKYHSN